MITVKNMKTLKSLPSTPKDGDLALLSDSQQIVCYKDGGWTEVTPEGDFNVNLYDINGTAIGQLPAHNADNELLREDIQLINSFIEDIDGVYFHLLCKELPNKAFYSTFFTRLEDKAKETMGEAVIDCLKDLGTIHAVSNEETHIEAWVKDAENNMICLMFFNCDSCVIGVK